MVRVIPAESFMRGEVEGLRLSFVDISVELLDCSGPGLNSLSEDVSSILETSLVAAPIDT